MLSFSLSVFQQKRLQYFTEKKKLPRSRHKRIAWSSLYVLEKLGHTSVY